MSSGSSFSIGIDIGGTKIAGAAFTKERREIAQIVTATPDSYSDLVTICRDIVFEFDRKTEQKPSVGIGIPGPVSRYQGSVFATNIPCLQNKLLQPDLEKVLLRPVRLANDADCAALSEAIDGAGIGCATVFGLIMGTGIGGGFVAHGKIIEGVNGLTGEVGHLPLPFREDSDGPVVSCACGQKGCIDKSISGLALA
ncbi:MAG: ROK family protein, partial [Alphaproteobacteria bacterium]|nr:ROK family protein [Alphaproteobacteria bacterium]